MLLLLLLLLFLFLFLWLLPPGYYCPLKTEVCKETAGLTYICPQKDERASGLFRSEVCPAHRVFQPYWLSRLELPIHITLKWNEKPIVPWRAKASSFEGQLNLYACDELFRMHGCSIGVYAWHSSLIHFLSLMHINRYRVVLMVSRPGVAGVS